MQPEASQVNGPQALRGDYCICSCSLSSINDKKWFPVLGFIGSFTLLAVLFILGCVSLLSKWNLITRYPVIFNFRVGTGRVLEKKFGMGRVPGSRRTLVMISPQPNSLYYILYIGDCVYVVCVLCFSMWACISKYVWACVSKRGMQMRAHCWWEASWLPQPQTQHTALSYLNRKTKKMTESVRVESLISSNMRLSHTNTPTRYGGPTQSICRI